MAIIDCSQCMEPHWLWPSYPFVSQSYYRGDEFQEFGYRWRGSGFSFTSAPGWRMRGGKRLDEYPLQMFAGVAQVLDVSASEAIDETVIAASCSGKPGRNILVLRSGHAEAVHNRTPEYWRNAPRISPGCAAAISKAGFTHVAVDLSCDNIPASRPGGEGGYQNHNEAFRAALHTEGLLLTENCANLGAIEKEEVFFVALPISLPDSATAPCRPIAMSSWPSDAPRIVDLSVPLFNHWRWKIDVCQGRSFAAGDDSEETHFLITGHGFTHCDAPCHMRKGGATIQDLPNEGLDLFVGEAVIADFSDLELPFPITQPLLAERLGGRLRPGDRLILRSDLTNRLGYESREWHLKAPNLEPEAAKWITSRKPAAVCIDFPQDYIAREMPVRHVYNEEFVTHHAVFAAGVPFVEDLRDLGRLHAERPFLVAVPLKTTCVDGAPMRAVALEW